MANEFKIDDIVDKKAIQQVDELDGRLAKVYDTYVKLVNELEKGLKFNPKSLEELIAKSNEYDSTSKRIGESVKEITKLQMDQAKALEKLAKADIAAAKAATETAKANRLDAQTLKEKNQASLTAQKTENERIKGLQLLSRYNQSRQATEAELTTIMNTQAHSIAEAEMQNRKLRLAVKNVMDTEANAAQIKEMYNKRIEENTEYIIKNSDADIRRTKNIGNYASHWNGLGNAIAQVTREFPAFTYSLQTGFLAISNNIPILADQIMLLRAQNKALREEGMAFTPVWKQVIKSALSWNTALSVGVTLLTVYGKDLVNWVASLFKGGEAAEAAAKAQERLNNLQEEAVQKTSAEVGKLGLLYGVTQDITRSYEERIRAAEKLQQLFPSYFANLTTEAILVGNASDKYKQLKENLEAAARAAIVEEEYLKIGDAIKKQTKELVEAEKMLDKAKKEYAESGNFSPSSQESVNLAYWEKIYEKRRKILDSLLTQEKELRKRFSVVPETPKYNVPEDLPEYGEYLNKVEELNKELKAGVISQEDFNKQSALAARDWIVAANSLNLYSNGLDNAKRSYRQYSDETIKAADDAKKAAEERLNIEREIEDIRLSMLDDGREKERKILETSYNRKIEDAKKNGEKEIELVRALEEQKDKALKDFDKETGNIQEDKSLELRLKYAREGSREELNIRREALELERTEALKEAEKTGISKAEVNNYYNKEILKLAEDYNKGLINVQSRYFADQKIQLDTERELEYESLNERYKQGTLSEEQYQNERLSIQEKYAIKEKQLAIDSMKAAVNLLPEEERATALEAIRQKEIELSNIVTETEIENSKRSREQRIKDLEKILDYTQQFTDAIGELGNNLFDSRIQQYDAEIEANEKAGEEELKSIEKLVLSDEEKEARKRSAEERTAQKNEELEKKKAEMQRKQAIFQKALDVSSIITNTAVAVMKVWAQTGIFGGPVAAAIVTALGAIQLATVLAQPIPKYAKGTDFHKGGLAVVGDGGKQEAVVMDDRLMYITPNYPVVVDLPRGAKVIPDFMDRNLTDSFINNRYWFSHNDKGEVINVINNNDYSSLEKKMDKNIQAVQVVGKIIMRNSKLIQFNNLRKIL
ncbi:MAG: hypothetical protein PUB21_07925 [Bacteroidales bacterium]|nr:hypothetical protein [Bacteroidales bacterium]